MKKGSMARWLGLVGLLASPSAFAESAELQHAHTVALLDYAEFEARFLFTALTSRELDPAAVKSAAAEIKRAIEDAKKSVDRSTSLLSDAQGKLSGELTKAREDLKRASDQLERFLADFDAESKKMAVKEEPSDELAPPAGSAPDEEAGKPDFELLKRQAAWLFVDVGAAQGAVKKLAGKLPVKLKAPTKPSGAHP